jgi:hypothetical protein
LKRLQPHFAECFEPLSLNGSRLTFYFSLASNGQIIGGQPRTVWFGLHASESDRQGLLAKASNSLVTNCFPVSLNREMARLIPGDVFYLQFAQKSNAVSTFCSNHTEATFRPIIYRTIDTAGKRAARK